MKKFIEIIDKSDTVMIVNTDNIGFIKVNVMGICTIVMNSGMEIKTEIDKDTLLKKIE